MVRAELFTNYIYIYIYFLDSWIVFYILGDFNPCKRNYLCFLAFHVYPYGLIGIDSSLFV
jgi:hypothetical protein